MASAYVKSGVEDNVSKLDRTIATCQGWVKTARRATTPSPGALSLVIFASFLFVACSNGGSDSSNGAAASAPGGDPAPGFELQVFGNESYAKDQPVSLSQFSGNPVVINFWYPSCAPCRLEMPDLEATFKNHKANGVEFIGVMLLGFDTAEEGQEFVDEFGITYPIGPDSGGVVLDYEVIGFPATVFLNRDHEIVRTWTGALNAEKLEEFVQELLQ